MTNALRAIKKFIYGDFSIDINTLRAKEAGKSYFSVVRKSKRAGTADKMPRIICP
jgi:hypothetical protein